MFETLPVHTPALVEQPMVKHEGRDYYAYFASAADKVVFLAVLNGPDRREAFRRANAWINLCPRRELLGEISLMDLNGNPLK